MSVKVIQEDSVGAAVKLTLVNAIDDTALDLTDATITFVFGDPNGNRTERSGEAFGDATDGIAIYYTTDEDLTEPGTWRCQVKIEYAGSITLWSQIIKIKVKANI